MAIPLTRRQEEASDLHHGDGVVLPEEDYSTLKRSWAIGAALLE
jgi:hypothetical protein